MITEEDIQKYSNQYTPNGEQPLVGVYGAIRHLSEALLKGLALSTVSSSLGGAVSAAMANEWGLFFVNNQRIVVVSFGFTGQSSVKVLDVTGRQIQTCEYKRGILSDKITVKLDTDKKLVFVVQKRVLGHRHHKERLQQIKQYLSAF